MRSLEAWLSRLEKRHPVTIDLGLERCGLVYRRLKSPRPAKKIITVAGTNGKGSTVAYLAALSGGIGQRYGTYTSPHIFRFNERIKVMGEPVADPCLIEAFEQVEAVRGQVSLTYFEFSTLAAFVILSQSNLDCAVLEVGLGGRLDTVNLVDADCAVITPIGLDHQDFLGQDIDSIATEKAGIIRAGIPVVCTENEPPEPVKLVARELKARVYLRGRDFDLSRPGTSDRADGWVFSIGTQSQWVPAPQMPGKHQLDNLAAALAATALLNPSWRARATELAAGIDQVLMKGRLHQVQSSPAILIDVGHNELAAGVVAAYLRGKNRSRVFCVLAMLVDKPVESVVHTLSEVCGHWLCCDSPGERGQSSNLLANRVKQAIPAAEVESLQSMAVALERALLLAGNQGTILVFGSFTTAAGAYAWLKNSIKSPQHSNRIEISKAEPNREAPNG